MRGTPMSIFLRTGDPRALASAFDGLIAAREIRAWQVDRYGNYFLDAQPWHRATFFHPATLGDGLRLNLHFIDKGCDKPAGYAAMHAAMVEAMLHRCGGLFHDMHLSPAPAYGDEQF